ncbi:MAG: metal-sensitive transcriptional regulator [Chloroflexota bacterium]
MTELPVPRKDIIARLKKIEGQVRGIQGMVAEERECPDILIQLAAARSAIHSVAGLVLRNYTAICLDRGDRTQIGTDLARAMSMWVG